MKNRIKNRLILIGLFALSTASFFSCSDDESYDFPGDSQNRVYLKSVSNTVNGLDKVSFLINKTPAGVMSNVKMKFPLFATLKANALIEVGLSMDNSMVDKYNAMYGTSFDALPDGVLTFVDQTVTILPDAAISKDSVEIVVNPEEVKSLPIGNYLISMAISDVKGEGVSISSNRNMTYIMIEVEEDTDNIWNTTPDASLKGALLTESRLDWTIAFTNISIFDDVKKVFDGDDNTYSYCRVDSYDDNTGFVVDMQKVYSNLSGVQKNFYNTSYSIKESDVYTSKDGIEWTFHGKFKNQNSQYSDILFYVPVEARYLKFIVKSASSYLYIRELNIFTKQ